MVATHTTCVIVSKPGLGPKLFLKILLLVWSNFEIASMDFWRGEAYTKYFEYLDATGGFYYEVSPSELEYSTTCC